MSTAGSMQTSRESRARRTLESASIDPTPHRLAVVRALQTTPSPAGAREVFLAARKTSPMDRVTAYRILALLEKRGVVERVASGEGRYRYLPEPRGQALPFPVQRLREGGLPGPL